MSASPEFSLQSEFALLKRHFTVRKDTIHRPGRCGALRAMVSELVFIKPSSFLHFLAAHR